MNETLFVPSHEGGVAFCSFNWNATNNNNVNYKIPRKSDYCTLPIYEIPNSSGNFTLASDGIIVPYDGYIIITARVCIASTASGDSSSNVSCLLGISNNSPLISLLTIASNITAAYYNLSWSTIVKKNDKIGVYCWDISGNTHIRFLAGNIVYV